jgi:hypothetical protein
VDQDPEFVSKQITRDWVRVLRVLAFGSVRDGHVNFVAVAFIQHMASLTVFTAAAAIPLHEEAEPER